MRRRLSIAGGAEGPPFWWLTESGPSIKFELADCLPTSLERDANMWAAASKLCCGTRGFGIVEEARWRVGEGGTEDFVPFSLEAGLVDTGNAADWVGAWSE